jgi:hypothetical protein
MTACQVVVDAVAATIADHGLSVEQAGKVAGMRPGLLTLRLAHGNTLTLTELERLAGALDVEPIDFFSTE